MSRLVVKSHECRSYRERGVAMVEYVIFAPVLFLMIFATGEFGRAMMQYNELTKGIREGVRYVAESARVDGTQVAQITAAVLSNTQNLVVYGSINASGSPRLPGFSPANVTVIGTATQDVVVTASYTFQPLFGNLPLFVQAGGVNTFFTFQASTSMRVL